MLFVSILLAFLAVYLIQMRVFAKHTFEGLEYSVTLSSEEVFAGEDIFMFEEIANNKSMPVPNAKVDTELPEGLCFRLRDREHAGQDLYKRFVQSVFVLKGGQRIKRRWRVTCRKRGVYNPGSVVIVANDLLGFNAISKRFDITPGKANRVVVLPRTLDLEECFTASRYNIGSVTASRSLLTDPLRICGAREYCAGDPINRINWKSTAVHGALMVNVEEYTRRRQFNIILNMQSRDIEADSTVPGNAESVELCITVAASLLDRVSAESIPVRLFVNTEPEPVGMEAVSDDETGTRILATPVYQGKRDMISALRLLAALKLEVSCPAERMLDHIAANAAFYSGGGNIVVVSSYISERMLVFHDMLEKQGVKVIFYVTTTNQNTVVPGNVEVYYRAYA